MKNTIESIENFEFKIIYKNDFLYPSSDEIPAGECVTYLFNEEKNNNSVIDKIIELCPHFYYEPIKIELE